MKTILNSFIICLLLVSCKRNENETDYFPSGNIKLSKFFDQTTGKLVKTISYYDISGNRKYKVSFHKNNYDSIVYYYNNGKVRKTGNQNLKGQLFGKCNFYTREGFLSSTSEYFIINNDQEKGSKINQKWYYNKKGDTMFYGNNRFNIANQKEFKAETEGEKTSFFVRFHFNPIGDTLSISEPFSSIAEEAFPAWGKIPSENYVVLAKEKFNFNSDFSNENQVKLDTFYCLEKDKKNGNKFPNADKRHTAVFGRWFDVPGEKILRGYMVEYYNRKPTKNNDIVKYERRTYFEKKIFVNDTIKKKNGL